MLKLQLVLVDVNRTYLDCMAIQGSASDHAVTPLVDPMSINSKAASLHVFSAELKALSLKLRS